LIAAKVHCAAPQGGAHGPAIREQTSRTINQRRGTTFSRHTPPNPGFMRVSEPSSRRKCRKWVDLTAGAWLSGRVLVSDVIRPRSFSPLSSALHRGRSALGFPEAPASRCGRASLYSLIQGVQIGLQLIDRTIHFLAESDRIDSLSNLFLKALAAAVGPTEPCRTPAATGLATAAPAGSMVVLRARKVWWRRATTSAAPRRSHRGSLVTDDPPQYAPPTERT
jgi:hypothetical protein